MFSKILIANRGEIAVRIIRAAKELSIKTVAVYSQADKNALHVKLADEAYEIGEPEPLKSYLNMERIIDVALKSGAEAIHPGYGFLSQNPIFAEKVEKSGLIFIGPSSDALKKMGAKLEARELVSKLNIPLIPGTLKPVSNLEDVEEFAEKFGLPILIKPSGGGGGIGMKIVRKLDDIKTAFEISRSEALAAFGNPEIYIEKYIEKPRHIEFQIIADNYGNVIHLYERECSIQRRYQKLVEESPSIALNDELRKEMGESAVNIAKAAGYTNAGTVEFLFKDNNYYFLEMNTRLQVEHGVTELVTGIDIVKLQIKIAADEKLNLAQEDIKQRGWAMEIRINAEDPLNNFTPNPGKIIKYHEPGGPGVRVDSGVYEGYEIPGYYDSLISKLMVWGSTRSEAVYRMQRAISEYYIQGIETTLPLHSRIFHDPDFIKGTIHTQYLNEKLDQFLEEIKTERALKAAIAILSYINIPKEMISQKTLKYATQKTSNISLWKYYGREKLLKSRV
ncbi:MAG: acetyl-CoA carboxylase biotin carboxylase subunit [Thermoprotei archaeon]|jgi:pyruvate carboxylase subunit A